MLAIFWSWTCVEKPELCGRGDKKQVRTLIFYLITCGCKLSLLWVLQPLYVKLVIWQDNLQIFWLDLTYTYLNLTNVLSLQIWPMNRWEITAQFVLLLSYYCTGHHSVNVYLYAGVVCLHRFLPDLWSCWRHRGGRRSRWGEQTAGQVEGDVVLVTANNSQEIKPQRLQGWVLQSIQLCGHLEGGNSTQSLKIKWCEISSQISS